MNNKTKVLGIAAAAAVLMTGCAAIAPTPNYDAMLDEMNKTSFRDQGIAKVERLKQDMANDLCSNALGKPLPAAQVKAIEAANLKTIKMPANGNFIGDWKAGEKLAQDGGGMTWREKSTAYAENGGNCYNCHQLSKAEISYGNIGPSLYNYGKLRGVSDPASPASKAIVEYTWGKLYNAKAYSACSEMPRFGHAGMLNDDQLRNLMALLLDPKSPINQ